MVKDHSDKILNPLPPMGYSFQLAVRDLLYAHRTAFVTPAVEQISQWVHHEGSIRQPIAL